MASDAETADLVRRFVRLRELCDSKEEFRRLADAFIDLTAEARHFNGWVEEDGRLSDKDIDLLMQAGLVEARHTTMET